MSEQRDVDRLDPIARRAVEQSIDGIGARAESFVLGLLAGLVAAIFCSVGWAAFTIATGMQVGVVAIALGMIVGLAVRYGGNGWESKFGILAAVLAFVGCVLGNYLSVISVIVRSEEGLAYLEVIFALGLEGALAVMKESFGIMDVLFYGIAVSSAYRMGYRE